jgi:hypothetical protein
LIGPPNPKPPSLYGLFGLATPALSAKKLFFDSAIGRVW